MTNGLSESDHIRHIIDCAPMHYESCVPMAYVTPHYKSVVVAKLLYASSAWAGFITAADRQRVDTFVRRRQHPQRGFCPSDIPLFEDLLKASDQQLFGKVIHNKHHLLYKYLPPPSVALQNYHLRPQTHNRQLPDHLGHCTDS